MTLLTHAIQCNLVKKLKTSDLFKAVNSTCYQPRLLVLNFKILYIIEVKLICLYFIDSIQYAINGFFYII